MEQYILTATGIIVSVGLFLLSYKQTIGARKERASAANMMLERTLLRRVVQEGYIPLPQDIETLIDGLARDHRVKEGDLVSSSQMLNTLYTRIATSDLIHSDQRAEILERLGHGIARFELAPIPEEKIQIQQAENHFINKNWILTAFLGVIASILGTLVSVYPTLPSLKGLFNVGTIGIFVASLGIISAIAFLRRIRDRTEQTSWRNVLKRTLDFEKEVIKVFRLFDIKLIISSHNSDYDFKFYDDGGNLILLKVKGWSQEVPIDLQKQIIDRLRNAVEIEKAFSAWVIVKDESAIPQGIPHNSRVWFYELNDIHTKFAMSRIA